MEVQRGLILTSSTDSDAATTSHEQQSTSDLKASAEDKKTGPRFFSTFSRMLTPAPRPASATSNEPERYTTANTSTTTSSKRFFSNSMSAITERAAADAAVERNAFHQSCSELESWPDLQDVLRHCLQFSPTDRPSVRSAECAFVPL